MKDIRAQPSPPPAAFGRPGVWELFWLMVKRDLKVRYAGATLGVLWNLIQPIVMILIYMIIFSSLMIRGRMGAGATGGNYAVHLCSGMLVWLVFADVLGRSVTVLVDNANFLQKVSFPPLILHASIFFNVVIIYGVGMAAFWLILALIHSPPPAAALLTFGLMILVGAAACGLGMILSALHVFFRDMGQLVQIALQLGFWLCPIVYPRSLLTESSAARWADLFRLNPVEHFVSTAQQLFGSAAADPAAAAPAVILIFPLICLVAGPILFLRLLPDVRDSL